MNNIEQNPMTSINFNFIQDKNLGVFDSKQWSDIGYDEIRDDLLTYYLAHEGQFDKLSSAVMAERNLYKERRQHEPNNCFSYASGLLTCGESAPDPFLLKKFDIQQPDLQYTLLSYDEVFDITTMQFGNTPKFHKEVSQQGLMRLSASNKQHYKELNPVILLNNIFDFHFFKADIYQTDNGPTVLFSDKLSANPVSEDYSLDSFVENHLLLCDGYANPTLFGTNKNLVNREMNCQFLPGMKLVVELKPTMTLPAKQEPR